MTNYYTRTISALREFLDKLTKDPKNHKAVVNSWLTKLEATVGSLQKGDGIYDLIRKLKVARDDLSLNYAGIRSMRLGLRSANINPRGPYGLPLNGTQANYQKNYEDAAQALRLKVMEVLRAIKGTSEDTQTDLNDLHVAITDLIQQNFAEPVVTPTVLHLAKKFRDDLCHHLCSKQHCGCLDERAFKDKDGRLHFLTDPIEPQANSSYWPSSFIASSSSSSTMPPAPSSSTSPP